VARGSATRNGLHTTTGASLRRYRSSVLRTHSTIFLLMLTHNIVVGRTSCTGNVMCNFELEELVMWYFIFAFLFFIFFLIVLFMVISYSHNNKKLSFYRNNDLQGCLDYINTKLHQSYNGFQTPEFIVHESYFFELIVFGELEMSRDMLDKMKPYSHEDLYHNKLIIDTYLLSILSNDNNKTLLGQADDSLRKLFSITRNNKILGIGLFLSELIINLGKIENGNMDIDINRYEKAFRNHFLVNKVFSAYLLNRYFTLLNNKEKTSSYQEYIDRHLPQKSILRH
jgi:hypothetical protein